jgi:hypothetical protein
VLSIILVFGSTLLSIRNWLKQCLKITVRQQTITSIYYYNTSNPIFIKRINGNILINKQFGDLFEISNDAIIGKTDHDFAGKCCWYVQKLRHWGR